MNEVKKLREPTCYNCPHRVHYGGDVPMKKYGVMMRLGDVFCVFGKKARRFKKSDPRSLRHSHYHRSDPTTGGRVSLFPAGGTDSGWRGAYHHGALSGGASAYRPGCD